jgi:alcohol dehydrogenase, propanol-preferring
VANLTRKDGESFMRLAGSMQLRMQTRVFPLKDANAALAALREGRLEGAAVLQP